MAEAAEQLTSPPAPDAAEADCALCGLPVDGGVSGKFDGEKKHFCCPGCRHVYQILRESGELDGDLSEHPLYRSALERGVIRRGDYSEDQSDFQSEPGTHERDLLLDIDGMWCSSCAWLLEHALQKEPGVKAVRCSFTTDSLRVRINQTETTPERVKRAVGGLGYSAEEHTAGTEQSRRRAKHDLYRLGVALFFGMQLMAYSVLQYAGYLDALPPFITDYLPVWLGLASAPIVFYAGWPILRKAITELKHLHASMETLVTLGSLTAFFWSVYLTVQGEWQVYYDTAAMLIILVMLGKSLESSVKYQATRHISSLTGRLPARVRLLGGGGETETVAVEEAEEGDRFLIEEGEVVPLDGEITEGRSSFDEAVMTGESRPVERGPGEPVVAGAVNAGGTVTARVTAESGDSVLSRIIERTEQALSTQGETGRLVDLVSRYFVVFVIALAAITASVLALNGVAADEVLRRSISTMVIACPCALSIATPLALAAAASRSSVLNLVLKNPAVLEELPKVKTVLLDKTGTVTTGEFELKQTDNFSELDEKEILEIAAGMEVGAAHPVADALIDRYRDLTGEEPTNTDAEPVAGMGLRSADSDLLLGNRRLLESNGIDIPPGVEPAGAEFVEIWLARDGEVLARFRFADRLRGGAREAVEQIAGGGERKVVMVSGDREGRVRTVAEELGIEEYNAEVLPAHKLELVEKYRERGPVLMVGDGVNDGPAMASADVSVAVGSGASLALEMGDVASFSGDIGNLAGLFELAESTYGIVTSNLFWAMIYNLIALPAAVMGYVDPIVAVFAMLASSLFVVVNSARLRYFRPETDPAGAG